MDGTPCKPGKRDMCIAGRSVHTITHVAVYILYSAQNTQLMAFSMIERIPDVMIKYHRSPLFSGVIISAVIGSLVQTR